MPDLIARAVNRINFEAKSTTKDDQIAHRAWILVDLDPVRDASTSANDEEMEATFNLAHEIAYELEREGFPPPVFMASGNGAYLLISVELPNDETSTSLVHRFLHGLSRRFDNAQVAVDLSTFNASRILKIAGTHARKGDDFRGRASRRVPAACRGSRRQKHRPNPSQSSYSKRLRSPRTNIGRPTRTPCP